jgi:hypothetical protein
MTQRILYPTNEGISILIPTGELDILEVARKDVPANTPYLIVNTEDIPADRTFRNAWEANFSNPDGYGIGAEAWFAEQEELNNDNN